MHVSAVAQQIASFAFMLVWGGVALVQIIRLRLTQHAYMRRFAGKIDFFVGAPVFLPGSVRAFRDLSRAIHEPQADPELEEFRRRMWRRFRNLMIWDFGFLLAVIAVVVPLIATGLVRLQ